MHPFLKRVLASLITMFIVCGFSLPAGAQALNGLILGVDTSPPGARANGMGQTFVAVADDTTATVTNPAGLANVIKPQVSPRLCWIDRGSRPTE